MGVTLAEAPRRGRLYAAGFDAIRQSVSDARVTPEPPQQPSDIVSVDNYGRVADDLRRDLSIAQVVCLDRR